MIKKILSAVMFLVIINASCSPPRRTLALEEGWDLLGEKKVDFVRSTDVIEIHSTYKFYRHPL